MNKSELTVSHLFLYLLVFFILFTLYEFYITPLFPDTAGGVILSSFIILILFTLPFFWFINKHEESMAVSFKKLWSFNFKPLLLVFITLIIIIYTASTSYLEQAIISVDLEKVSDDIMHSAYLDVLAMEIIFRGFLLNACIKKQSLGKLSF